MEKTQLKYILSRWGVLPRIDLVRRLPKIRSWIKNGCSGPAPPPLKRMVLSAYLQRFQLKEFVESGTYMGDTLAYIAFNKRVKCTSIELSEQYYSRASQRFSKWPNVNLVRGDSGSILPEIVKNLKKPAMFWLDGHYSGASTALGKTYTPVCNELEAILESPIKTHVVLIDDARCFDGNDYPQIDEVLKIVRSKSRYRAEVSADIIRLTPKKLAMKIAE